MAGSGRAFDLNPGAGGAGEGVGLFHPDPDPPDAVPGPRELDERVDEPQDPDSPPGEAQPATQPAGNYMPLDISSLPALP